MVKRMVLTAVVLIIKNNIQCILYIFDNLIELDTIKIKEILPVNSCVYEINAKLQIFNWTPFYSYIKIETNEHKFNAKKRFIEF